MFQSRLDKCVAEIELHDGSSKCAYFCLLYGSAPSETLISNAIVLGRSLRSSKYPLVLLLTPDVPSEIRLRLVSEMCPSEVHVVDYIYGHCSLYKKRWFLEVFTKFHVFNQVQFNRIIFLDLDILVNNVCEMDKLFDLPVKFAAMENSKSNNCRAYAHGEQLSGGRCCLLNAGVMLVSPNTDLFKLLCENVTAYSPDHEPGMTPEQYYLARVMGHHFHHLHQKYNMEVEYHGGVPYTDIWQSFEYNQIVAFHFSGGDPLEKLKCDNVWECQTHKHYAFEFWKTLEHTQIASSRAEYAFAKWATLLHTQTIPYARILVFETDDLAIYVENFKFVKIYRGPPKRPPPIYRQSPSQQTP